MDIVEAVKELAGGEDESAPAKSASLHQHDADDEPLVIVSKEGVPSASPCGLEDGDEFSNQMIIEGRTK